MAGTVGKRFLDGRTVIRLIQQAGWSGREIVIHAAAVFRGESLWGIDARGDLERVGQSTDTGEHWGPSVGWCQIRSIREHLGSGDHFDEEWLSDPENNAAAAFELYSRRGWQPWGAHTNGSYRKHMTHATVAYEEFMPHIEHFVQLCLDQTGDDYVFGAEARPSDPDPDKWDCSELVEWACHRLGVSMVDGSMNQLAFCRRAGAEVSVADGINTRGALLFRETGDPKHVAISLGDGRTIEARGSAYGVGTWGAYGRFTAAARIPEFDYDMEDDLTPEQEATLERVDANVKLLMRAIFTSEAKPRNRIDELDNRREEDTRRILEAIANKP